MPTFFAWARDALGDPRLRALPIFLVQALSRLVVENVCELVKRRLRHLTEVCIRRLETKARNAANSVPRSKVKL